MPFAFKRQKAVEAHLPGQQAESNVRIPHKALIVNVFGEYKNGNSHPIFAATAKHFIPLPSRFIPGRLQLHPPWVVGRQPLDCAARNSWRGSNRGADCGICPPAFLPELTVSLSIRFFRKPTTVLSIAALGIGLSVSDINFAQTLQPGAGIVQAQPETPVAAQAAEAAPTPVAVESGASDDSQAANPAASSGISAQDAECLAKIVQHEAANQPERVQLAVAHVVLNRMKSSVFPHTICAIALQRGQFFNVHAYRPYGDARWPNSQRIANRAIAGEGLQFAPGALFFHTAGTSSGVSRSHPHIARLGGLDFYR